jgi:hypothetical protein
MKNIDLLAVWGLSFITFMTSNQAVAIFAITASITTIIKNLPGIIRIFKNFKKYINEKL